MELIKFLMLTTHRNYFIFLSYMKNSQMIFLSCNDFSEILNIGNVSYGIGVSSLVFSCVLLKNAVIQRKKVISEIC